MGRRKDFNHFAPFFIYKYVKTSSITISELKAAAAEVHGEIEQFRTEGRGWRPPGRGGVRGTIAVSPATLAQFGAVFVGLGTLWESHLPGSPGSDEGAP